MREILTGHVHTRQRGTNMRQVADYPHVFFIDLKHYEEALALAQKLGGKTLESFNEQFALLERICTNSNLTAEVHPDCVQNSFYFRTYHKDKAGMDGGIILHGMGRTFSVELCPKQGVYWSMHT